MRRFAWLVAAFLCLVAPAAQAQVYTALSAVTSDVTGTALDTGGSSGIVVQIYSVDGSDATVLVQQSLNKTTWTTRATCSGPGAGPLDNCLIPLGSAPYTRLVVEDYDEGIISARIAVNRSSRVPTMVGATEDNDGVGGTAPAPQASEDDLFLSNRGTWIPAGGSIAPLAVVDVNTVEQKNGTNAQTFRIYNTSSGANYERAAFSFQSNVFRLDLEKGGSGTYRSFYIYRSGAQLARFTATIDLLTTVTVTGDLYPNANQTYNLGFASSGNWGTLYLGNGVQGARSTNLTEGAATEFRQVSIPTNDARGGTIEYTVYATDGTEVQILGGVLAWNAINVAGVVTCGVSTPSSATEVPTLSTGTLTNALTCSDYGGEVVSFAANATSSLTQTILRIYYRVNTLRTATYYTE